MPNSTGWARIRRVLPDAVAYAIDRNGMQVAFNCEPIYHSTGRWISNEGKRVQLGLIDTGPHFDGASTLEFAPDYTPGEDQKVRAAQLRREATERGFGGDFSPETKATDPRDKGPDAIPSAPKLPVGAATASTVSQSEREQMEAMGAEVYPSTNSLASESQVDKHVDTQSLNCLIADLSDALLDTLEALPKTTRAKLTKVSDKLKEICAELRAP